ncbi:hypothetical protein AB1Y20_006811 [Prymnesium parvum]|uniref:RanBP2-type domain-containing protein n=1 Tax=Prymnesium parvum TaxID=97485 RepID=A0AB34IZG9_PRYPA
MTKERRAIRERRHAHYLLRTGQVEKRELTDIECTALERAINYRDMNALGIRNLVHLNLDRLFTPQLDTLVPGLHLEQTLSLIAYAAWRRRAGFVKKFLTAGASATVSHRAPRGVFAGCDDEEAAELMVRELLCSIPGAAAAYAVQQVVRLRQVVARSAALGVPPPGQCALCGGADLSLTMEPCGCVVCEQCLWRGLASPPLGLDRGEIHCPKCGNVPPFDLSVAKINAGAAGREEVDGDGEAHRTAGNTEIAKQFDGGGAPIEWRCDWCFFANFIQRHHCRNCGADKERWGAVIRATAKHNACAAPSSAAAPTCAASPAALPADPASPSAAAPEATPSHAASALFQVEITVQHRRTFGKQARRAAAPAAWRCRRTPPPPPPPHRRVAQLIFVLGDPIGPLLEVAADGRREEADSMFVILDRSFMDSTSEAELVMHYTRKAIPSPPKLLRAPRRRHRGDTSQRSPPPQGERLRALGTVAPCHHLGYSADAADGGAAEEERSQQPVELLAQEVALLRPLVCQWDWPRGGKGEAADGAAEARRVADSTREKAKSRFTALPALEAALHKFGQLTEEQRREALEKGIGLGDTALVRGAIKSGFQVDEPINEYGQTMLHVAAMRGQVRVVDLLVQAKASLELPAAGGSTPATAAAAHGHWEALARLLDAGARAHSRPPLLPPPSRHTPSGKLLIWWGETDATPPPPGADVDGRGSEGQPPLYYVLQHAVMSLNECHAKEGSGEASSDASLRARAKLVIGKAPWPTTPACYPRLTHLIGKDDPHPGRGSLIIDDALPVAILDRLERLFHTLPVAPRHKMGGLNDRSYVCDADAWIRFHLQRAVQACDDPPLEGEAMPQMRFLIYNEAGGGLPPHYDLSRTDLRQRTTTHTFILYLTDNRVGGETVLLQKLKQPSGVRAEVTPRRGRLLLFPHGCPHLARQVVAEGLPKLLLRGEML